MGYDFGVDVGSNNNTHHILPSLIRILDFEASDLILKDELPRVSCASLKRRGITDCKRVEIRMSRYPCQLVRLDQFRGYAAL